MTLNDICTFWRQLGRLLVFAIVLPPVLILEPARHDGATLLRAVLRHGAVDEVDAVEEVHHMNSDPVVDALTRRQLHHRFQVQPGLEGGLGFLVQLEALGARLKLLSRTKCFVFVEDLLETQCHHGQGRPG